MRRMLFLPLHSQSSLSMRCWPEKVAGPAGLQHAWSCRSSSPVLAVVLNHLGGIVLKMWHGQVLGAALPKDLPVLVGWVHEKGAGGGCVRVWSLWACWSCVSASCVQEARTSVVKATTEDPSHLSARHLYQGFVVLQLRKCGSSNMKQNPFRYHRSSSF